MAIISGLFSESARPFMLRIMQPLMRSWMVSLPPLRGEIRGYLLNAVARLRFPGSTPAPMWQEAQASLLSMWRILGSATSGPMYSEVCEIRRLPYSSVAPTDAEEDAVRSAGEEILAKARVAATVIKPARAQSATTTAMPRVEESGFMRGSFLPFCT